MTHRRVTSAPPPGRDHRGRRRGAFDPHSVRILALIVGRVDLHGIGVPKGSDAADSINAFLRTIEDDGTWLDLWKTTIQTQTWVTSKPTPPAIGEGID